MLFESQGHPGTVAVTAVGNDDEDENIDVEGDTETTMYDIVYGGGGVGGGWPQQHRMRQQSMILHAGGGYSRGKFDLLTSKGLLPSAYENRL